MNGAFYIGATGLEAQQKALEVIANDIANMNTPAYKRTAIRFSDMVHTPAPVAAQSASDVHPVSTAMGVRVETDTRIWDQGDLRKTDNPMNIAIEGEGFFEVMGTNGQPLLWRGGTLKVNDDGYLATADGLPFRAMISIPTEATNVSIDRTGMITAITDNATGLQRLGQLDLVMVSDKSSLGANGGGYYTAPYASAGRLVAAGEEGSGAILQSSLEGSNVQLSAEMIGLMLLQRAYAANAQLVQAGDQLMGIANNLRRQG